MASIIRCRLTICFQNVNGKSNHDGSGISILLRCWSFSVQRKVTNIKEVYLIIKGVFNTDNNYLDKPPLFFCKINFNLLSVYKHIAVYKMPHKPM